MPVPVPGRLSAALLVVPSVTPQLRVDPAWPCPSARDLLSWVGEPASTLLSVTSPCWQKSPGENASAWTCSPKGREEWTGTFRGRR